MNVKKLIKEFEERKTIIGNFQGYAVWWEDVKEIFEQLDEPGKVTIPWFVADWIEECKLKKDLSLGGAIQLPCPEIYEWLIDWKNQELFARAWLDGYEVEKEKRYRISMPKARNYKNHAQFLCEKDGKMFWCAEWHRFRTKFTRKELEEVGFGWVFDCEGVEVQEVE